MAYEAVTAYLRGCNAAFDAGVGLPAMDGLTVPEQARVTRFLTLANPYGHPSPEIRGARLAIRSTTPLAAESPGAVGDDNQAKLRTYLASLAPIEGEQ